MRKSFDIVGPVLLGLPKYLASIDYKNPTDPTQGAFQFGHNTTEHFFGYLKKRPEAGVQFNNHMAGKNIGRAHWYDPYCVPIETFLGKGARADKEAVMLVDVGGGTGRDITGFHQAYPNLPGRLILEDMPAVVENAKLPAGIEALAHDFFTPQPIKGEFSLYVCQTNIHLFNCRRTCLLPSFDPTRLARGEVSGDLEEHHFSNDQRLQQNLAS